MFVIFRVTVISGSIINDIVEKLTLSVYYVPGTGFTSFILFDLSASCGHIIIFPHLQKRKLNFTGIKCLATNLVSEGALIPETTPLIPILYSLQLLL